MEPPQQSARFTRQLSTPQIAGKEVEERKSWLGASHTREVQEDHVSAVGGHRVTLRAPQGCEPDGDLHTARTKGLDIKEDGSREHMQARAQASSPISHQEGPAHPLAVSMASSIKTFLACSLLAFVTVHAGQRSHTRDTAVRQAASSPVVTVKNGSYEGLYSLEYDQDFFLGMRYAQVNEPIRLLVPYLVPACLYWLP